MGAGKAVYSLVWGLGRGSKKKRRGLGTFLPNLSTNPPPASAPKRQPKFTIEPNSDWNPPLSTGFTVFFALFFSA